VLGALKPANLAVLGALKPANLHASDVLLISQHHPASPAAQFAAMKTSCATSTDSFRLLVSSTVGFLPASGMAAFYSATAHLVSWLGSLPHASEWVAGQNLADPNTWNSSALQTLKELHCNLLTHYNCSEWAPPLADDAPAPETPAQDHDDDSARPLSLPPLNLLTSLRVRQDEDNGEVAAHLSLPPQRQVTKHIMQTWTLHDQMLRNPPTTESITENDYVAFFHQFFGLTNNP
jgi:hypothetical protein